MFRYCLVGRFPGSRPPLALIREWFRNQLKLKGEWSVTLLDPSHVFVRLENQEDMVRVWARKRWFIKGSPFFRTSDREDPSLAAVWVSFPSLPVVFFQEEFLFSISALVGNVLTMDEPTRKLTPTNVARVCVAVDLLKELPQRLWIGIGKRSFWQEIAYENLPSYCTHCLLQGHSTTRCRLVSKDAKQSPKSSLKLQGDESHKQFSQGKVSFDPPVTEDRQSVDTHISVKSSPELPPEGVSDDETKKTKDRGGSKRKQRKQLSVSVSGTNVVATKKENVSGRTNDQVETGAEKVISQKHGGSSDQSSKNEESDENEKSERLQQGGEKPPSYSANSSSSNSLSKRSHASRSVSSAKRFFFWKRRSKQTRVVERSKQTRVVERISEVIGRFGLKQYKYSEIKQITGSFSDVLGRGGFGTVYKGRLPNGQLVAVKIPLSLGDEEEFVSEVEIIGRTYHVNIVRLLGFCSDRSRRALVYEYIPNGTLDRFIYANEGNRLEWGKLLDIAVGVARGLQYLHQGCNICVVHSDIKPRNVLLDEFYRPKISDFGLARAWGGDSTKSTYIRGTRGYIAPEVFLDGRGTSKSDVYSYGVLLLEMAVRRSPFDAENLGDESLPDWVYEKVIREPRHGLGLGGIAGVAEGEEARKMVLVGLWCVQAETRERPSMNQVVRMLEGRVNELQMPLPTRKEFNTPN